MAYANVTQVAKALNLTPQRVQQLVAEGLPKVGRGQYELPACMLWYIRYLQRAVAGKSTGMAEGGHTSLMQERTRQAHERTKAMEISRLEKEGRLVELSVLQAVLLKAAAIITQGLDALPQRLNVDEKIQAIIEEECRQIRNSWSDAIGRLAERKSPAARSRRRAKKKTKANAKRMGRPVPSAPTGNAGAGTVAEQSNAIHDPDIRGAGDL